MAETSGLEPKRDEALVLVDRLIRRQGLSREEALRVVDLYRVFANDRPFAFIAAFSVAIAFRPMP
jgi:hypothetical protein